MRLVTIVTPPPGFLNAPVAARAPARVSPERDSGSLRTHKPPTGTHDTGRKTDRASPLAPGDETRFGGSVFLSPDTRDHPPAPPSQAPTAAIAGS